MDDLPVPISGELWARLKALDRRCDCFMNRRTEWRIEGAGKQPVWTSIPGEGATVRRAWFVRISLQEDHGMQSMVDGHATTLAEALLAAVTVCEKRGWHLPPGVRHAPGPGTGQRRQTLR